MHGRVMKEKDKCKLQAKLHEKTYTVRCGTVPPPGGHTFFAVPKGESPWK